MNKNKHKKTQKNVPEKNTEKKYSVQSVFHFLMEHKVSVLFSLILIAHIFFMFYQLEYRMSFDWDQLDNAWQALRILVEHKYPLVGMAAKGNSGFNIGPLYYYMIAVVYFFTNLNPIASGIMAGLTSIFAFLGLYYVTKKIFSDSVALVSVFIYTISNYIIFTERPQWPVNFVPVFGLLVFYFLYKTLTEDPKFLLPLGLVLGFSFHIHFTSIFYPIIILLCLPFYPWSKRFILYGISSVGIFILFLLPIFIANMQNDNSQFANLSGYSKTYYHGFHLRRFIQIIDDAFLEVGLIIGIPLLNFLKFLLIPIFLVLYLYKKYNKKRIIFAYLILLWFLVPWVVFSTYKGEISNYYFYLQRLIIVFILSYITVYLFQKPIYIKAIIVVFWAYYSFINIQAFINTGKGSYLEHRKNELQAIQQGQVLHFQEGVSEYYLFYVDTVLHKKK